MAFFIALATVAVERLINRRRLKLYEVLADLGWLTLIFAAIEFAWLYFVESFTLNYGAAARLLWYTEWPVFKILFLDVSIGVFLILTSVWLESAGIRIELRRPTPRFAAVARPKAWGGKSRRDAGGSAKQCDIEWHEAT